MQTTVFIQHLCVERNETGLPIYKKISNELEKLVRLRYILFIVKTLYIYIHVYSYVPIEEKLFSSVYFRNDKNLYE